MRCDAMRIQLRGADIYSFCKPIAIQKLHWSGTISINKSKSSFFSREPSAISITNRKDRTPFAVGCPHGRRGWLGGHRRHPDCIYCCNIKPATYRMQPCNPPSAYKHEGDFENVLAYSTAHELSSKPILLEPWRHIQSGPGTIRNSASRSFLSKLIGWSHHAKSCPLYSMQLGWKGQIFIRRIWMIEVIELIWAASTFARVPKLSINRGASRPGISIRRIMFGPLPSSLFLRNSMAMAVM